MNTSLLKITVLASLAAAANAQAFNWTLESPTVSPTQRERITTGTDGTLYYMYGGQNGSAFAGLDQLYTYDGTTWTLVTASGASAGTRSGAAGAFDIARGKFVVFGGNNTNGVSAAHDNDTWEWDATNGWVNVVPTGTAGSPDARWLVHSCIYVPGVGVVFHGGAAWDAVGTGYKSTETWAWNGTTWSMLSNSGPQVQNTMMVYRSIQGDVILHGGQTGPTAALMDGETWRFDLGTYTWTQIVTPTIPRSNLAGQTTQGLFAAMTYYNPITGMMVVHGGNGGNASSATWQFDGTDWTDISSNGVGCRNGGMQWIDALGKGVYGPCNEANGTKNRTRSHGPQAWGSFELLGDDCPVLSSGLTGSLSSPAMPAIGTDLDIDLTNGTVADLSFMVLGATTMAPVTLSSLLFASGATCNLQISPDVFELTSNYSLAIPNDVAFIGVSIYAQCVQTELVGPDIAGANTQYAEITFGQL